MDKKRKRGMPDVLGELNSSGMSRPPLPMPISRSPGGDDWPQAGEEGLWASRGPHLLISAFSQTLMASRASGGGKSRSSWTTSCPATAQVGPGSVPAPVLWGGLRVSCSPALLAPSGPPKLPQDTSLSQQHQVGRLAILDIVRRL